MRNLLDRMLANLEWRLSLGSFIWGVVFPTGSFILPAWATSVTGVFFEYAPLSWVVAGFAGLVVYAVTIALYGYGQVQVVRARYNRRFMVEAGGVDPLAKVFEGKRIYLNDFILPSNPRIDNKTFVDCEIVGPGNIFLAANYNVSDIKDGRVDAVVLDGITPYLNGYMFFNCTFRGCTFHRITLFFTPDEALRHKDLDWLNWISFAPQKLEVLNLKSTQSDPTPMEDQLSQSQNSDRVEKSSEDVSEDPGPPAASII